jgi:hypothetical protein
LCTDSDMHQGGACGEFLWKIGSLGAIFHKFAHVRTSKGLDNSTPTATLSLILQNLQVCVSHTWTSRIQCAKCNVKTNFVFLKTCDCVWIGRSGVQLVILVND